MEKSNPTGFHFHSPLQKPTIFFDGDCLLCIGAVQTILKYEKSAYFHFASLNSEFAKQNIPESIRSSVDSIILIENGKGYIKTDAVWRITPHLKVPFSYLKVFKLFGNRLNHWGYDLIAKYRYKIFGKKENACMLLTPQINERMKIMKE